MSESPRLLLVLDDARLAGVDCREVTRGNPGMGGAEYLFVALAYELGVRGIAQTALAHFSGSNQYPASVAQVRVTGSIEGPWRAPEAEHAHYVIVRGYHDPRQMARVIRAVPGRAPLIVWAHNHLRWKTYDGLAREQRVCAIVFVGEEQAALAAGARSGFKSVSIPNGFYAPPPLGSEPKSSRAVYAGNLAPSKGFHRLARLWPQIRRRCPEAELDVIGSARLYGGDGPLGSEGLAEPSYEKKILALLDNDPARHGVVFHGKLGLGKFPIMQRSRVGLPNPTGFTECCPGSVLELAACGNAVVAPRRWGMCDTVVDQVTGRLCTSDREYVSAAAELLADPERAQVMGRAGQEFVRENFSFRLAAERWGQLLEALERTGRVPQTKRTEITEVRGDYPFKTLRVKTLRHRGTTAAHLGAMLAGFDRAHGWVLRTF